MAIVFYALLCFSILLICGLAVLAKGNSLDLRGRALHPYNVLGFLFFIVDLDFITLLQLTEGGVQTHFAQRVIYSENLVTDGYLFFLICQASMTFGVAMIALPLASVRQQLLYAFPLEVRAARFCMLLCIIATIFASWQLILVSLQNGSFTYIAGVRQRFFAGNPVLLIIVSTIAPAFILFGSRNKLRAAALALIPLLPFLALVGGRSKLLYPLIAFLYWVCRRVRLSAALIYVCLPVLLLVLSLFTFVSRQNGNLADFPQYLSESGGLTGTLFDEASISMAEIISINVADPAIERQPWESLVGGLMLPLPRSILPFKPLGASTQFSMTIDPARWELVKSEWTITGFINLMYDFGSFGAFGMCAVLGALWAWVLQRASVSRLGTGIAGPVCCLVAYQFVRGDLYIVAQFLWPLLIVMLLYWVVRTTLKLLGRKGPRSRRGLRITQSGDDRLDGVR